MVEANQEVGLRQEQLKFLGYRGLADAGGADERCQMADHRLSVAEVVPFGWARAWLGVLVDSWIWLSSGAPVFRRLRA